MNCFQRDLQRFIDVKFHLHSINFFSNLTFVPKCEPVKPKDVELLRQFVNHHKNIFVLTGAGISTESGIPDYRSQGVGLYATSSKRPVLYKDFCENEAIRQRYWARNYIGWPTFSSFQPNDTHKILAELEKQGKISQIVTQNVDNLHFKAGSKKVIELHGTAFRVMCLSCDNKISRYSLQEVFHSLNPNMRAVSRTIRPDGDVELSQEQVTEFQVPSCKNCGGILKPDIVFFGDNVPKKVVDAVKEQVEKSDSLLILGTSLTTFSGYRIVLQAEEASKPIAIVNIGPTRADANAEIKIEGKCAEVLNKIHR